VVPADEAASSGSLSIPHLVGELAGRNEDRFALFSGHVDSWHYGAMDNGTANAFWSGHSHGRYAGSAWYADHAWRELHQRCILHLNVGSPESAMKAEGTPAPQND